MKKDILAITLSDLDAGEETFLRENVKKLCDEIIFLRSTLLKISKEENSKQKYKIIAQKWIESERNWGQRPDGVTIHLDENARLKYVKSFWDREKERNKSGIVPDEYTRESGDPFEISVSKEIFDNINKSENKTIWVSNKEFDEIEKENK